MENATWVRLLRQVPAAMRQRLTVITNVGAEISIQDIIQMSDEYLVLRGRLAGTNDTGRLFLVPFSEITYVSSVVEMRDDAIRAVFCKGPAATTAAVPEESPAVETAAAPSEAEPVAAAPEPEALPTGEPTAEQPAAGTPQKPAGPVNRAELLQRIRNRATTGNAFRPINDP